MLTIRNACLGAAMAIGCSVALGQTAEDQLAEVVVALGLPQMQKGRVDAVVGRCPGR